jgi:hypothetical protein
MGLFRRKARPEAQTITEFWQWWVRMRDAMAVARNAGLVRVFADDLSSRVEAIHPGLDWEVAAGTASAHALIVTPNGQAELRATTARWLAAAPPADETWSYRSARAADPAMFTRILELRGYELELAHVRYDITVNEPTRQVDVVCYHPAFAGLPDHVRDRTTFLTLAWAVGEEEMETWIGRIGWTATEPVDPKTPGDLWHAVAAEASDDEGGWLGVVGERPDGAPLVAMVAVPLRPARWPLFDLYVPVRLPYRRYNESQLPGAESTTALHSFEDELRAAIGASGEIVAHETGGRLRTLHFYVDSQTNARAAIESYLPRWREGRASTRPRLDPAFDQVRHLMR